MLRPILFFISLLTLWSCRKEPDMPQPARNGGTWAFKGRTDNAVYSETESRSGYQLHFADNSGGNRLSFWFRTRPSAGGTFVAAADTSKSLNIWIHLVHDGIAYHSETGGAIDLSMTSGKLFLQGTHIRMRADSTTDADGDLDFSLREY